MRKATKRRPTNAEDLGLKIIVLKGSNPNKGKVLFPEKLKIANEIIGKIVDKSGKPLFKKNKRW